MADKREESVAGKIATLSLSPERGKMKEFTYISRFQATLFPLLDTIIRARKYILEVALYMEDPKAYEKEMKKQGLPIQPIIPDLAEELLYSTSQWQRSVGKDDNLLSRSFDLAIADIQSQAGKDMFGTADSWSEEDG